MAVPTVIDFGAPDSVRALEELQRGKCRTLLLQFGTCCTGSEADAEDLLSDAMQSICDPQEGRPWDPTRSSFLTHARIVMRDLARRGRRSARARREVLDGRLAFDETTGDERDLADGALEQARELERDRRLGGLLCQRLDPTALRVFEYRCQGKDDCAELAIVCKCSVEDVYDANQRIAYQAGRVLAEERQAEADKMKALQEQAKKKKWAPWRPPEKET
jgi:DNA-directed RNA polymerase specialized sigma24 family protein